MPVSLIVMLSVPFALVGGMVSSTVLTLGVFPNWYALARTSVPRGRVSCSTVRDVSPLASELTWRPELAARRGDP